WEGGLCGEDCIRDIRQSVLSFWSVRRPLSAVPPHGFFSVICGRGMDGVPTRADGGIRQEGKEAKNSTAKKDMTWDKSKNAACRPRLRSLSPLRSMTPFPLTPASLWHCLGAHVGTLETLLNLQFHSRRSSDEHATTYQAQVRSTYCTHATSNQPVDKEGQSVRLNGRWWVVTLGDGRRRNNNTRCCFIPRGVGLVQHAAAILPLGGRGTRKPCTDRHRLLICDCWPNGLMVGGMMGREGPGLPPIQCAGSMRKCLGIHHHFGVLAVHRNICSVFFPMNKQCSPSAECKLLYFPAKHRVESLSPVDVLKCSRHRIPAISNR
ncbi:hypothetical protein GQ607_007996, partial [Colletotrichum asianum]